MPQVAVSPENGLKDKASRYGTAVDETIDRANRRSAVQVDAFSANVAFTWTVRVPDMWPPISRLLAATDTGICARAASPTFALQVNLSAELAVSEP